MITNTVFKIEGAVIPTLKRNKLIGMYRIMVRIRAFEERIAKEIRLIEEVALGHKLKKEAK